MTRGLVLGKFAPLHKGHQLLIETGLAETDKLTVLIYNALETTNIPLNVRADWIRKLYPQTEVIEARDGPTVVGDTPEIKNLQERFILKILGGTNITHFYSSEFYGDHVSNALGAIDRRIDSQRLSVPVSGTSIRNRPFDNRLFLDPLVYRDMINWIVFLGAPSAGKTTICETLANVLNTVWMPEYGREYWDKHNLNRRLSVDQLVEIVEGHRNNEDEKSYEANEHFFIDTDASTTRLFSLYYHNKVHPQLESYYQECKSRYDLFFLCDDDIPYDNTEDRSGELNRSEFQQAIRLDLQERQIPFTTLSGTVDKRIQTVRARLKNFNKWK